MCSYSRKAMDGDFKRFETCMKFPGMTSRSSDPQIFQHV